MGNFVQGTIKMQITAFAMWSTCIQRKCAFVQRIHLGDLRRMKCCAGHSEVRVAAGVGENLYLVIDSASEAPSRIRQRKIAMNERVARLVRAFQKTKRAMIENQGVAKLHQLPARIFGSIGAVHSVMQMNLKFAPTFVAMRRKTVDQSPVILFRGKKISVNQGAPFLIAPR